MSVLTNVGVTICQVCKRQFTAPVRLLGSTDPQELLRYLADLIYHFQNQHREADKKINERMWEFGGMLRIAQYRTTDPDITGQLDFLRWRLHQQTLAARIPDDKLIHQVDELAGRLVDTFMAMLTMAFDSIHEATPGFVDTMKPELTVEIICQLMPILRGIRDVLEEPGRYPQIDIEPIMDPSIGD
jgi:hypothetical protein